MSQGTYEARKPTFARNKALILKILSKYPGLTALEIVEQSIRVYGYPFYVDARLREMRKDKWIRSDLGPDGLLHWTIIPMEEA